MPHRSFLVTWCLIFACCFVLAAAAYAFSPSAGSGWAALSYVLWPGVGLYTALNGSLLFGGGFGKVGNFLLIAAGSAFAWSFVMGLLMLAWRRHSKALGQ